MKEKNLTIALGTDSFPELVTKGDVFVDKTLFIKEIIDSGEKAILITRPRRWGKSLALDMLKTFLEVEVHANGTKVAVNSRKVLFEGGPFSNGFGESKQLERLNIAKAGKRYIERQGQFPVIFISFKDVKAETYQAVKNKLSEVVITLFGKYEYLYNALAASAPNSIVARNQAEKFERILSKNTTKEELDDSLRFLTELLHNYHHEKVYVLVDEYDKPVNYLLESRSTFENKELQDTVAELVTGILSPCGKGNDNLEKILLTGIFDTVKKTGNSGFNNVQTFGVNDIRFSAYFGFTEAEVAQLTDKLNFGNLSATIKENIKDWYDGYNARLSTGSTIKVYTPWAVMNYLSAAYKDSNLAPKGYWSSSGASQILNKLINLDPFSKLWDKLNLLLQNQEVAFNFSDVISLFAYNNLDERLVVYLLLHSGYLTVRMENGQYKFKIPNREVEQEFKDVIITELASVINNEAKKNQLTNLLSYSNREITIKVFNEIHNRDGGNVEKLLDEHQIPCSAPSYGLSFLHLAILTRDSTTIAYLINYCGNQGWYDSYGLSAADYAYIADTDIDSMLIGGSKCTIITPGYLDDIICGSWKTSIWLIDSVFSVAPKVLKKLIKDLSFKFFAFTTWFIYTTSDSIHESLQSNLENDCANYHRYYSINIDNVSSFQALQQVVKYKMSHNKTYAVLGANCSATDAYLTSITLPVFRDKNFANLEFSVSVCEKISAAEYMHKSCNDILLEINSAATELLTDNLNPELISKFCSTQCISSLNQALSEFKPYYSYTVGRFMHEMQITSDSNADQEMRQCVIGVANIIANVA